MRSPYFKISHQKILGNSNDIKVGNRLLTFKNYQFVNLTLDNQQWSSRLLRGNAILDVQLQILYSVIMCFIRRIIGINLCLTKCNANNCKILKTNILFTYIYTNFIK